MHSTGLRALSALAVGLGLGFGAAPGYAQYFEGEDAGFPAPEGDASVLPADAKLMRVFDDGCVLTEGVAAGEDGFMYFSDITFTSMCKDESGKYPQAGNIWKYDPRTGEATVWRSPSGMSNGLKFDKDGNMIAALGADYGGRMLVRTDMATGKSYILTGLYDGKPYNALNDITIDEQGRIYFSDPRYLGHEPIFQPGYAVYRLDPAGTVERIITDGGKTNGVLVSPDQQTLYVVSNDNGWFDFQRLKEGEELPILGRHELAAYDLAPDGTVSNRRVLVDYAPYSGPDGLVADVPAREGVPARTGAKGEPGRSPGSLRAGNAIAVIANSSFQPVGEAQTVGTTFTNAEVEQYRRSGYFC